MERIFAHIDQHLNEYVGWLEDLCRVPSLSSRGEGLLEAASNVSSHSKVLARASGAWTCPGDLPWSLARCPVPLPGPSSFTTTMTWCPGSPR